MEVWEKASVMAKLLSIGGVGGHDKYSILTIPKSEVPAGRIGGATPCTVAKGGEVWAGLHDRAWPNFPTLDSLVHKENTIS